MGAKKQALDRPANLLAGKADRRGDRPSHRAFRYRFVGARAARHIPCPNPRFRLWTKAEDHQLGTISDRELARRLGRTLDAVVCRRVNFGIPKFGALRHYWDARQEAMLGKFSDEEVARRLNRSLDSVSVRRARLGIPKPSPRPRRQRRDR